MKLDPYFSRIRPRFDRGMLAHLSALSNFFPLLPVYLLARVSGVRHGRGACAAALDSGAESLPRVFARFLPGSARTLGGISKLLPCGFDRRSYGVVPRE